MRSTFQYENILAQLEKGEKLLAILIDPEKFDPKTSKDFLKTIPKQTTHLFVGGSTVPKGLTEKAIVALKNETQLPIFIFPGDASQITPKANALLFLSLLSGNNPKFLIGQQKRAASQLKGVELEVIPTGYLLIDGGNDSAVARVTDTTAMSQENVEEIVNTALAAQLMGAKLLYLEAGSGAKKSVAPHIIKAVKSVLDIPIIVGGGIRTAEQKQAAYNAGASMVVMGTVFESSPQPSPK